MTLTELDEVTPGRRLGTFRYPGGPAVHDAELAAGVLPDDSEADSAFVVSDDSGRPIGKVALESLDEDAAEISLATRRNDPLLIRRLVGEAMTREHVNVATVEADHANQPPETLEAAGFQPDASGNTFVFVGV